MVAHAEEAAIEVYSGVVCTCGASSIVRWQYAVFRVAFSHRCDRLSHCHPPNWARTKETLE